MAPYWINGMQTELGLVPLFTMYGDAGLAEASVEGLGVSGSPSLEAFWGFAEVVIEAFNVEGLLNVEALLGLATVTGAAQGLGVFSSPVYRAGAARAEVDPRLEGRVWTEIYAPSEAWVEIYIDPNER